MKENNIKIIFFIIIIVIIIIAFYLIIKNNNTSLKSVSKINKETNIDNTINFGILNYDTLNPILSQNEDIQYISKLLYKSLIDITQDFKLKPSLAEEWNKLDNKTYLIKLKEDVLWSNNERFTSKDVEYTINYIKKYNSIYSENIKNIENIEIINEYMFKITLIDPEINFEYMLTFPIINSNENLSLGDYFLENEEDNIVIKDKNSNKRLIIKTYNNMTKLYNAFLNGEIDVFVTNNTNYQKYIGHIGHIRNVIIGREFDYLKINQKSKYFLNNEVVQAINLLINKNEINNKVYNNLYNIAEFPLQYGSYLYNNNIKYEYNINKAQKILEDAGWAYNRKQLEEKWFKTRTNTCNKQ